MRGQNCKSELMKGEGSKRATPTRDPRGHLELGFYCPKKNRCGIASTLSHDPATTTKAAPFDMAKSSTFIAMKGVTEDSLNFVAPHISFLRKETSWRLSKLKSNIHVQGTELNKLNTVVSKKIQSTLECLEAFKQNVWQPPKDQ
ncbi:uncharacterized protein LOC122036213 isoform X3 [Zingiber officinale]|uniref:uncharacterized protein LOC122036213 isoform X3 n=1 Tax=Zingiber officinale TaxID=94328 RepID=UPI001C4D0E80|nr:uncharacterized protein LOC122036213 isoform X3 [Zingiber officinale]